MNPGDLLLTRAVSNGDTKAVRDLLTAGSDVNTTIGGQTPLILAIAFRHIEIAKILLAAGGDPELKDSLGFNAIDWAKRSGSAEELGLLANNQAGKSALPADEPGSHAATYEEPAPPRNENQNVTVLKELEERAASYKKSQQWLRGLQQRIAEERTLRIEEPQPPPVARVGIEDNTRKETPYAGVDDSPPPASLALPKSEVVKLPSDRATDLPNNARSKDQTSSEQASVIPGDLPRAQPELLSSTVSSRKRCPKCYALYDSVLLAYCAIDMTPLVDADSMPVTPAPERSSVGVVWLLVVVTFIAAAALTYVMIPNWIRKENPGLETSPIEATNTKNSPLVTGDLSGKQVSVPPPDYPVSARNAHVAGWVTVQVTVNKEGKVTSAKVIEGDKRLRKAAISAAQKAIFSPEKLQGRGAVGTIAYAFQE